MTIDEFKLAYIKVRILHSRKLITDERFRKFVLELAQELNEE
jgi:hypothetical protein